MQRTKRVPSLVRAVVRLCARLWPSGWVENDSVVNVARGHRGSVFTQRLPMRPRSLSLYGTVFHPLRCYFPGLWPGATAAWTVRMEMDRRRNDRWRVGPLLHSGAVSRPVLAKRLRRLSSALGCLPIQNISARRDRRRERRIPPALRPVREFRA